jgi:hypothetical protein
VPDRIHPLSKGETEGSKSPGRCVRKPSSSIQRHEFLGQWLMVHLVYLVDLVSLVHLVCFVYLVDLVYLVGLVQPNKQDKPNKPNKRDRLADFLRIRLDRERLTLFEDL